MSPRLYFLPASLGWYECPTVCCANADLHGHIHQRSAGVTTFLYQTFLYWL